MNLVSIIIPTYNYGHFLPDTLDNVLEQTHKNWECIIIDNGSTDNTEQIVAPYLKDTRFKYFQQENKGVSYARNMALKLSSGNYIQFLDADDKIEGRKLELQLSKLTDDQSIDIVYGSVRYFASENQDKKYYSLNLDTTKSWMPNVSGRGDALLAHFINNNIMVINAPLLRRSVIEKVGYFNEELFAAEDWDYWFRCALANLYFQFYDHDQTHALVRFHGSSLSKAKKKMYKGTLLFRQKINVLSSSFISDEMREENSAKIDLLLQDLAYEEILNGNFIKGWKSLRSLAKSGENNILLKLGTKASRRRFKNWIFKRAK